MYLLHTLFGVGKTYVRGYDKTGHPIVIMRPSKENTYDHKGNIRNLVYTMERAVACGVKSGQEKLVLLIDYEGYSIFNAPPMHTARETLTILQDHYPERLHRAYCIHPPILFYTFYQLISPFIDHVTKQKIVMMTDSLMNNPDNQLFQEVDRNILELPFKGHDNRTFHSETYLNAPFDEDFLTTINNKAAISPQGKYGNK